MSTVLDEVIEKLEQEEEDLNFLQFGIKCWVNMKYSQNDTSLTPAEYERLVEKRSAVKQKLKDVKQRKMELIKVRNALIPVTVQPETEKANEE
jgi:hypothetical protein